MNESIVEGHATYRPARVYVDKLLRLDGLTTWMLRPFFGGAEEDPREVYYGIFNEYTAQAGRIFSIAESPSEADCAVVPHHWKDYDEAGREKVLAVIRDHHARGLPVILFYPSESCETVDWPPGVLVFRYDLLKSRSAPCEFSLPVWCSDFQATQPDLDFSPRRAGGRPSISFCGYAPPLGLRLGRAKARSFFRYLLYRIGLLERVLGTKGHAPRVRAISLLRRSRQVVARFIIRDFFAYGGQWGQLRPGGTYESAKRFRREYAGNMVDADYTLSARGVTNTSIRCYEALSCGRVPLFLNTDCRLPGDFCFDWKSVACWVEESELEKIGSKVAEYHASLDDAGFADVQRRCRRAYEEWIAPEGFFSKLGAHIEEGRRRGVF